MKKIVLPLLILLLLALPGCTKAAPVLTEAEFADPYVPLTIRQADGTVVDTALSAYVRRHEVLVPLAAVTDYLNRDYLVAADGAGLTVTVAAPKFALETPRLTELIKDGVDFRVNAVPVFGSPHINLRGLEKLLGITIGRSDDGKRLVVAQIADSTNAV